MSARPDLIPCDTAAELERLHDRVPPFPFGQVRGVIEHAVGRPLGAISQRTVTPCAEPIREVRKPATEDMAKALAHVDHPALRVAYTVGWIVAAALPVNGDP